MTKRQPVKLLRFLERVNRAAKARGKKTELAGFLDASRQQVNAWLSGAKMPGGEITLLMLEWVQAEEAKQQETPGGASNTTKGRKTRSPNPVHEKSKRIRKKR
ncbi:MAG: hypothetical protein JWR69_2657 [Pedosphaera sp.]|nr:hypothetical protein [Pedosphaera sp.]